MIIISRYSGKCDVYDSFHMRDMSLEEQLKNTDVYMCNGIVPLKIEIEKDIVPFYPYTIGMASGSDGRWQIHLSHESFVDREERERLEWYQKDCDRYIKRCRRKKIQPSFEEYIVSTFGYENIQLEIFNRTLNKNNSLDGIHLPMHEYYRKELYNEMLRVGWTEFKAKVWVYGWGRLNEKV